MKSGSKLSLVGWGNDQAILHVEDGIIGISFWKDKRLCSFSKTPWLRGHFAVLSNDMVKPELRNPSKTLIQHMRTEALKAAHEAVLSEDLFLLSEAIITTYMAQQMMGHRILPAIGEIGKRYAGDSRYSLYLFATSERVTRLKETKAVLMA